MNCKVRKSFVIVAILLSACSSSKDEEPASILEIDCPNQITTWADRVAVAGNAKTAHIFWKSHESKDDIIITNLYADLSVYCEESCEVTEDDEAMYSFYRATHYWDLEKVFDEFIQCEGTPLEIRKANEAVSKKQRFHTDLSSITTTWKSTGCAFEGGPKQTEFGGCISVKSEPRKLGKIGEK